MILINRKLNKSRFSGTSCKKIDQYKIPHNKLGHLKKAIEEVNWNDHFSEQCLENNSRSFMTKLSSVIHGFIRKVKPDRVKKKHLPWLNDELRSLMKQRDLALKMSLKKKSEHEKRSFVTLRYRKEIRQAEATFFINAITDAKGNAKDIWKNLKK